MAAWRSRLKQLLKHRLALRNRWPGIGDTLPKASGIIPAGYFAGRLLRDEEFLLYENPEQWSNSEQLAYTTLLRWYTAKYGRRMFNAKKTVLTEVARIDYRLGLFNGWEALEDRQGIMTSRHIEKALRWDRWSDSYRGIEFAVIRKYVKGGERPLNAAVSN